MSRSSCKIQNLSKFTSEQKISRLCEQLCLKIRRNHPKLYNEFLDIARQNQKPSQASEFIQSAIDLLHDIPDYQEELQSFLYMFDNRQIKFPNMDYVAFEQQMRALCEFIKSKSNEKLQQFLREIEQQKDTRDFSSLLANSKKIFIHDNLIFQEISKILTPHINADEQNEIKHSINLQIESEKQSGEVNKTMNVFMTRKIQPKSREQKTEMSFFSSISQFLLPKQSKQVHQILYLYIESIITSYETIDLLLPIFNQLDNEEFLTNQLREMLSQREQTRRKLSSNIFKPLNQKDFQQEKRIEISYVERPISYCIQGNQNSKALMSVLNQKYVSVPMGTQHQNSFQILRKNQHEEELFKCEDEMYDFDLNIRHFKQLYSPNPIPEKTFQDSFTPFKQSKLI